MFAWGYAAIVAGFVVDSGVIRQRIARSRVISWLFFRLVENHWLLRSQRSGLPVRDQPAMTTATPTTPEATGEVLLKSSVASPVGSARVPVASPSETLLESSSVTL